MVSMVLGTRYGALLGCQPVGTVAKRLRQVILNQAEVTLEGDRAWEGIRGRFWFVVMVPFCLWVGGVMIIRVL